MDTLRRRCEPPPHYQTRLAVRADKMRAAQHQAGILAPVQSPVERQDQRRRGEDGGGDDANVVLLHVEFAAHCASQQNSPQAAIQSPAECRQPASQFGSPKLRMTSNRKRREKRFPLVPFDALKEVFERAAQFARDHVSPDRRSLPDSPKVSASAIFNFTPYGAVTGRHARIGRCYINLERVGLDPRGDNRAVLLTRSRKAEGPRR
jgi:hypothetical protein